MRPARGASRARARPLRGTPRRRPPPSRRPETTALYQAIAEQWPGFRERVESLGELPRFVVEELEGELGCGVLERGCLHLSCRECGHSQLVAFSCKQRGR